MAKVGEIIRGDDQTLSIPVSGLFTSLIGATAYLFVIPTTAAVSDAIVDPAAIITCTLGPFATNVTQLDFVLKSTAGAGSTLVPVGTYAWYARVKEASNTVTTIRLKPRTVKVIAPGEEDD
jgi:hypothetical protein